MHPHHLHRGRHAAPGRLRTARRAAAAVAAIGAGAVPLAAGPAEAAATHDAAPPAVESLVGQLSQLPAIGLAGRVLPGTGQESQAVTGLLHDGAVGALAGGLAPQARQVTAGLARQASPVVGELNRSGVPRVRDLTARVAHTQLPALGSVGAVMDDLPVGRMLAESPFADALNNLADL